MKQSIKLFLLMFRIGLFTFGGGYAMIPLLEEEFVSKRKWLTHEEFMDLLAIAESTPGPIAINSATYIGYKQNKFIGALASVIGVCLPSLIIIYIISLIFDSFLKLKIISNAFKGIQVCVVFLIFKAGIKMFKELKKDPINIMIFTFVLLLMITFSLLSVKFSTIIIILICGCFSILTYYITKMFKGVKK